MTLRRLNRIEYRNTIRDLLGVDFDTDKEFPPDDIGYGFDNIGDVLSFSPLLAEKYMAAGEKIVAAAVPTVAKVMPVKELPPKSLPKDNKATQQQLIDFRNISPYFAYTKGGKLDYAFRSIRLAITALWWRSEVRGSFDFDPSRLQLAFKLDGQEKMKEEHVWINMKTFRYEFAGQLQPGQEHQFELEGTPLPPAKDACRTKNAEAQRYLQKISVRLEGPLDRKDWPYGAKLSTHLLPGRAARRRRGTPEIRPRGAGSLRPQGLPPSRRR